MSDTIQLIKLAIHHATALRGNASVTDTPPAIITEMMGATTNIIKRYPMKLVPTKIC
jgi:hypothetical protein